MDSQIALLIYVASEPLHIGILHGPDNSWAVELLAWQLRTWAQVIQSTKQKLSHISDIASRSHTALLIPDSINYKWITTIDTGFLANTMHVFVWVNRETKLFFFYVPSPSSPALCSHLWTQWHFRPNEVDKCSSWTLRSGWRTSPLISIKFAAIILKLKHNHIIPKFYDWQKASVETFNANGSWLKRLSTEKGFKETWRLSMVWRSQG